MTKHKRTMIETLQGPFEVFMRQADGLIFLGTPSSEDYDYISQEDARTIGQALLDLADHRDTIQTNEEKEALQTMVSNLCDEFFGEKK